MAEHKPEAVDTRKTKIDMHPQSNIEEASSHVPLPSVLKNITFFYTKKDTEGYDFPNIPITDAQLNFFGNPHLDLPHTLGILILRGEESDVETVLAHVRENPALLES